MNHDQSSNRCAGAACASRIAGRADVECAIDAPSWQIDYITQHLETKREIGNKLQSQMAGKNRLHQVPAPSCPVAHRQKMQKMTRNLAGYRHASGWMQRLVNKSPDNAMKCL
jgi:hypothetical protein